MSILRTEVVRVARTYLGTPFVHQGRLPGIALDCAGVLICMGRELGFVSTDYDYLEYSRIGDGRAILSIVQQHCTLIPQNKMQPGDIVVVAIENDPQHVGIVGNYVHGGLSIIHGSIKSNGEGKVAEARLVFAQNFKFVAAFKINGIQDI